MIVAHNLEELLFHFPTLTDERGSLTVAEQTPSSLPFSPQRVFWIYDLAQSSERGGHAHRTCWEMLVAVSGRFSVTLKSSTCERTFTLHTPQQGLLIPPGVWCTLHDFSPQSVCLCMASEPYEEAGYIKEFLSS